MQFLRYAVSGGAGAGEEEGNEGAIKTAADLKAKVGVGLGTNTMKSGCVRSIQAWMSVPMMTIPQCRDPRGALLKRFFLVDRPGGVGCLVKKTNNTLAVTGEAFSSGKLALRCVKAATTCLKR